MKMNLDFIKQCLKSLGLPQSIINDGLEVNNELVQTKVDTLKDMLTVGGWTSNGINENSWEFVKGRVSISFVGNRLSVTPFAEDVNGDPVVVGDMVWTHQVNYVGLVMFEVVGITEQQIRVKLVYNGVEPSCGWKTTTRYSDMFVKAKLTKEEYLAEIKNR